MSKTSKFADDFLLKYKNVNKQDEFLKGLGDIEKEIYKTFAASVNDKLLPELRNNKAFGNQTKQPEFLDVTPQLDPSYVNSNQNFYKKIQQSQPISLINHQQNTNILDFPIYEQNYLDTNANSKFYRPPDFQRNVFDTGRQFTDQANAQNYMLTTQSYYEYPNPDQKQIYPRSNIDNQIKTHPLPEYIQNQEKDFSYKPWMDKMGGLVNTINPMQKTLKENEERLFAGTPQHSFLMAAISEKPDPPPIREPPPKPKMPDPFNTNPQYRLDQIQVTEPQGEVQSYLPVREQQSQIIWEQQSQQIEKQEQIQEKQITIKLSIVEQSRIQRQQKYQPQFN